MHAALRLISGLPAQTSRVDPNLRCDHCRRELGNEVHRYWRMRFCSPGCVAAYQRRLGEDTKVKIRRLEATGFEQIQSRKAAG